MTRAASRGEGPISSYENEARRPHAPLQSRWRDLGVARRVFEDPRHDRLAFWRTNSARRSTAPLPPPPPAATATDDDDGNGNGRGRRGRRPPPPPTGLGGRSHEAMLNIIFVLVIIVLLLSFSSLFSQRINQLVVVPITRMITTIDNSANSILRSLNFLVLEDDPLVDPAGLEAMEEEEEDSVTSALETEIIEQARFI